MEFLKIKCPDCNKELIKNEYDNSAICSKCSRIYDKEELENIKDAQMIEEDMAYYSQSMIYK